MQVIFVGDFFQLPPVSRGAIEFAFEHPAWRDFKLVSAVLTTQYRQEDGVNSDKEGDPLLAILNEIRAGEVSPKSRQLLASRNISIETEDHTELFTRNVSVDSYNTERLNSIHDDTFIFDMSSK